MIEVTCVCGWQTRGSQEEVILDVQQHGRTEHGQDLTPEEIMAIAQEVI